MIFLILYFIGWIAWFLFWIVCERSGVFRLIAYDRNDVYATCNILAYLSLSSMWVIWVTFLILYLIYQKAIKPFLIALVELLVVGISSEDIINE